MAIEFREAIFIAHQAFRELMNQEMSLASGLQSLAPSNKEQPSRSSQYLYEDSLMLKELSEQIKDLMPNFSGTGSSK